MAYTSKQLTMAWTAVHNGVAPDDAAQKSLDVFATFNASGQVSDADAMSYVLNSGDDSTALAALSYQFFTGKAPTKDGMDYLLNSATNPNDLNDPYYVQFNAENRYINFAANLGVNGEGAPAFAAKYGAMSLSDYVASIYETIIGSAYAKAAGVDVAAAIAFLIGTKDDVLATARAAGMVTDAMTPAQVDLALKAALAGLVMAASVKSDIGVYAASANNFMLALAEGKATYGADLVQDYGPTSGKGSTGTGQAVTTAPAGDTMPGAPPKPPPPPPPEPPAPAPLNFTLTASNDRFTADSRNNTFTATDTTLNAGDRLDGGQGNDTLIVNVAHGAAYTLPMPTVSNIETLQINASGALTVNLGSWTNGFDQVTTTSAGQTEIRAEHANLTATVSAQGVATVLVQDADDVTLTVTGGSTGTVTVNDSNGDVVIQRQNVAAGVSGGIVVRGGATIDITQTAGNTVGNALTNSAVEVHGDSRTSTITVAAPATAGDVTANTVKIYDVNGGSSLHGFITRIEVDGYSALTIQDNALQTLKIAHGGDVDLQNGGATTPETALDLTVNGVVGDFTEGGAVETLHITQGAVASQLDIAMAALKTLTVDAVGDIAFTGLENGQVESITLSGAGEVDLRGDLADFTHLTTFDASARSNAYTLASTGSDVAISTGSGDDTLTLTGGAITKAVALGAGDDTLILSSSTISATLDGGAGSHDLLQMSSATAEAISNGPAGLITGFEVLDIGDIQGLTIDAAKLGVNWVKTFGGGSINGLTDGATLEMTGESLNNGFYIDAIGFGGAHDHMTVLISAPAPGTPAGYGDIRTIGVEAITVEVDQLNWTTSSSLEWHDYYTSSATIKGAGYLSLTVDSNVGLTTVDASGFEGKLQLARAGNVSAPITITGNQHADNDFRMQGSAAVTYIGGDGDDTVNLGGGANTIDVGTGADTVILNASNSAATHTFITGLGGAGDRLGAEGITLSGSVTQITSQTTLTGYMNAASASTTASTTNVAHWFELDGDAYVVIDASDSATYDPTHGVVVRLVGMAGHFSGALNVVTDGGRDYIAF